MPRYLLQPIVFVSLLISCCFVIDSEAATYYVRSDGNDSNSGTGADAANAWATLTHATTASLSPGDIVYVQAGTYSNGQLNPTVDGASGSRIRIVADRFGTVPGWTSGDIVLQAGSGERILQLNNDSYLEFTGFKMKGSSSVEVVSVSAGCLGIVFRDCELYDGNDGFDIGGSSSNETLIVNCLVRNNAAHGMDIGNKATVTVWNTTVVDNTLDGINVASPATSVSVTNCIIANNGDDGFDLNGSALTHTYNLVFGNGDNDFEGTSASTGEISVDPQFVSAGIYWPRENSPVIDSGANASGTVDDDLAGNTRPLNSLWDMGCYEGSGLAVHWKVDSTSGTTATDSSAFVNDGTYTNGPTLGLEGIRGNAVFFDGTDDYVGVADNSSLRVGNYVSMASWIYPDSTSSTEMMIINKEGEYEVGLSASGELRWAFANTDPSWSWHNTGYFPPEDAWTHVAVSYNNGEVKTYANGELVETYSGSGSIGDVHATLNELRVGGRSNSPVGKYFKGRLDDVRVYKRSVSALEVTELYGLIGHWKLDETSGSIATDSSGIGNDGSYWNGSSPGANGPYPGDGLNAAELPDVDAHVGIASQSAYDNVTEYISVAAWVNFDTAIGNQTAQEFPIARDDWATKTGFALMTDQPYSNCILFRIFDGTTYADAAWHSPDIEAGEWHHVSGTYDGSNVRLYVDGELKSTTAFSSYLAPKMGSFLNLGWGQVGRLFDVRLYNRAITAEEVSDLYGLVGHWKMNESTGFTAADSTGYANDATLSGATWTSDCAGHYALEFDGAGGVATTDSNFDPPETGAVAFWLRSAGNPGSRSRPFGVGGDWEMRQESNGTLSFDIGGEGPDEGAGPDAFITNEGLSFENRWYHVIAQFDSTDESFEVYIDGVLVNSGNNGNDMTKQAENILSFGTRTGSTEYWEGAMRDFRIYNRWLLQDEIGRLTGMIAHWLLNESSGSVAIDSGVLGNDATFVSSPTLGVAGPYPTATSTAVELDGSSQLIDSGQSLLNDVTEFTIMGWVRPDDTNPNSSFFGQNDLIELGVHSISNQIRLWTASGGEINAAVQLPFGKWSHIVGTGSGTELRIYVNGRLAASGGSSTANYGTNGNSFKIGEGVFDPSGGYLDGRVDDVRVYNRLFCPNDVNAVYKEGRPTGVRIIEWVEAR